MNHRFQVASDGEPEQASFDREAAHMVKPRQIIMTIAAGAALAGPISLQAAMEIARAELARSGLAGTYQVSALYADSDRQTEGAAFAVIARLARRGRTGDRRARRPARLKLLVHHDGGTSWRRITASGRAVGVEEGDLAA